MPMFTAPIIDYGGLEAVSPGISDKYGSWGGYQNYNVYDPGPGLGSQQPTIRQPSAQSLPSQTQPIQVSRPKGIPFGERMRLAFDPTYSINQSPWKEQLMQQAPEQSFLGQSLGGAPAMSTAQSSTAYPTWGQTGHSNTPLYYVAYPSKAGKGMEQGGGGGGMMPQMGGSQDLYSDYGGYGGLINAANGGDEYAQYIAGIV